MVEKAQTVVPLPGSRWLRNGQAVRVMAVVEGWVVARYTGAMPFLRRVNEWSRDFQPAPQRLSGE